MRVFDHDRPAKVASDWVDAVLRRHDLAAGWPLMSEGLRHKAVRAWIDANVSHPALADEDDPDALCEALAKKPTGHRVWGGYAVTQVREFCKAFDHLTLDHCGFASDPRPLALDLELIVFVDTGSPEPAIVDAPEGAEVKAYLPHVCFIMRLDPDAGWLVEDFTYDAQDVPLGEIKPVGEGEGGR